MIQLTIGYSNTSNQTWKNNYRFLLENFQEMTDEIPKWSSFRRNLS
jgi:hypothetical protein